MQIEKSGFSTEELKAKSVKSVFWNFLSNILTKVLTPFFTIVLARLLTPEDYGIVAVASLIIALINILQTMGLGQTLVQRQQKVNEAANVVFWFNFIFSVILFSFLYFTASFASIWFDDPRVIPVLRIMGFQIVIRSFGTVQSSLLQKQLKFRKLFWFQLIPALIPGIIAIPLAWSGYGYWSLVYGTLAGSLVGSIILWIQSPWRPSFTIDFRVAKEMLNFGFMVSIEAVVGWVHHYFDNALVGHFLGTVELGLYSLGYRVVMMVMTFCISPFISVGYSSFSSLQNNQDELRAAYINLTKLVGLICIPVSFGIASTATPITHCIFGAKWNGLELVLMVMSIMPGLSHIWTFNPEVYRAMGKPEINAKLSFASLFYVLPVFYLAAPHGLKAFLIARFSVGIVFFPIHWYLAVRIINLPWTYLLDCTKKPIIASVIMVIVVKGLIFFLSPLNGIAGKISLLFIIFIGAVTYAAVIFCIDKKTVNMITGRIKKSFKKKIDAPLSVAHHK